MTECMIRSAWRHSYAHAARHERKHVRGTLHKLLDVRNAVEETLNLVFFLVRETRFAADLLHVIAIGLGSWDAPGGSMGLLKEPRIGKISHHVTDCGRTQPLAALARKDARTHAFPRFYQGFHSSSYNF